MICAIQSVNFIDFLFKIVENLDSRLLNVIPEDS